MNRWKIICGMSWPALICLALIVTSPSCHSQKEDRTEMPSRDINTVMNDHTAELMKIPGVTGVAIGELEDKRPCIQVLVVEKADSITARLPKSLEGYPVEIVVSGIIRPMDGNGD